MSARARHHIATHNEGPLHAGLKDWYAEPGDAFEVPIDGRQIDIVRGDLLIEIQTRGFGQLKRKLTRLLRSHTVRLVHPIPLEKWLVKVDDDGAQLGRRRSPKRLSLLSLFEELVSIPKLLDHPRFSLEVLLTQEEEVRREDPDLNWRRHGWRVVERRLVDVMERHLLEEVGDLRRFIPPDLPSPFTTADLATSLQVSRGLAQKMAYCLREAGVFEPAGNRGRARAYTAPAAGRAQTS